MCEPYTTWIATCERVLASGRDRGWFGTGWARLEVDPPATVAKIEQAEAELGRRLPDLFRKTLLDFSRRFEFWWFLPQGVVPPKPLENLFCGGCNWDLDRLVTDYQQAQWYGNNIDISHGSDKRMWQDKLPFHSIGSGDCIAFDLGRDQPETVVYLSHDDLLPHPGQRLGSHNYVLGDNFFDFMNRWTAIGCPNDAIWPFPGSSQQRLIDVESPSVLAWCDWLGLPRPNLISLPNLKHHD